MASKERRTRRRFSFTAPRARLQQVCSIVFVMLFLLVASGLMVSSGPYTATSALTLPTGVIISGEIERITITQRLDHWSGGIMQVGGQGVIIPRNLLIDLPANRLTLKEI